MPVCGDGSLERLIQSEYFLLEILCAATELIRLDTKGETFHAITVIEGQAILRTEAEEEQLELDTFQTAVVPASTGRYHLEPLSGCRALKASL
jgi:mannose-6-phosphate isomerase